MKFFRFRSVICVGLTTLALLGGCSAVDKGREPETFTENTEILSQNTENFPEKTQTPSENTEDTSVNTEVTSEKTFLADSGHVKLIGRTQMNEDTLWLAHSASGIEFMFTGKSVSVTLVGDGAASGTKDNQARFAVYVNGEKTMDEQVGAAEKTYEIFNSEETADATITLLKLSESANSTFGIKRIDVTSVGEIAPTEEKELKIEFIGDSITCGYGVDDEVKEHHFSTSTEDATKAYAYKTAQLLNADYSLVSYSGHGIISGYTGNGEKSEGQLVPKLYEQFARTYGSSQGYYSEADEWDFGRFVPDFVVINLGTNDYSYTGIDEEKIADYRTSYVDFLKTVRKNNPKAHIIGSLGVMGDNLYPAIEEAVRDYTAETGDDHVSAFHFTPQNGSTGFAADWHPTEATHEIAAKELAKYITSLMQDDIVFNE